MLENRIHLDMPRFGSDEAPGLIGLQLLHGRHQLLPLQASFLPHPQARTTLPKSPNFTEAGGKRKGEK